MPAGGTGINGELAAAIQGQGAVGYFDDQQGGAGMFVTVVGGRSVNDRQVGFRFRVRVNDERHVHADLDLRSEEAVEDTLRFPDGCGMGAALRSHGEDIALDQLNAGVRAE